MRLLPLALLAVAALSGCIYEPIDGTGYLDCRHNGGSGWTNVVDDPLNCGGCGVACYPGVPCVDYACQMDTVMHCGAGARRCLAAGDEAKGVDCVRFDDPAEAPEGVELVGGYGCVQIDPPVIEVLDDPPVLPPSEVDDGRWLMIPGHTELCAEGLDVNGCVAGNVTYFDGCADPTTEMLAYDVAIMAGEMNRGTFRALMCDCDEPAFAQCRRLCEERDAPDAEALAAMPMTGVNWCEAYTACQRLGARLPTLRERALVESLVDEQGALFEHELSCTAWAESTDHVPWVAECLDEPVDELGLDRVKGEAGRVWFSGGALTTPEPVHHLPDNVSEWVADSIGGIIVARTDGGRAWGLPVGGEEYLQPRLVHGRSLFSPAGQSAAKTIAVEASVNANDLGLRCARTVGSPFEDPVPYDASHSPYQYASCEREETGLRPVRRSVGEQVYRAVDVCVDTDDPMPAEFAELLQSRGRQLLVRPRWPSAFARRSIVGDLMEVGLARFAMDEQWWLVEPADEDEEGDQLLEFWLSDIQVWLTWRGEEMPRTSRCAEAPVTDPSSAETAGRIVRRHELVLDHEDARVLGRGGASAACAHLDCVDRTVSAETCEEDCSGWILPFAVEFERVEPMSALLYCY